MLKFLRMGRGRIRKEVSGPVVLCNRTFFGKESIIWERMKRDSQG